MPSLRTLARPLRPVRQAWDRYRAPARLERQRRVEQTVYGLTGGQVAAGPFQGMHFVERGSWGSVAPLLLGTYEAEIQSAVEQLIAACPARVVDVGTAEGYYTVGMARRLPAAIVHGFDTDANAQRVCGEVAKLNGVDDRVIIGGTCATSDLDELAGPGCVAIIDCEGYEKELLDPALVPGLRDTMILVELHDCLDPTISAVIRDRFAATHVLQLMTAVKRDPAVAPITSSMSASDRRTAVNEFRQSRPFPMQWALLTPR